MSQRKTEQERAEIVQELNQAISEGETLKAFAKRVNISTFTLSKWRKQSQSGFKTLPEPAPVVKVKQEPNGAEKRFKILELENQRLKIIVANQCLDIQALKEYCGRA